MEERIINEIINHVNTCGGLRKEWYVGIAEDPKKRLFSDHNVSENGDSWILRDASNETAARAIEEHLLNLGFDGGGGGGSYLTHFVYAYRKAYHTKENN